MKTILVICLIVISFVDKHRYIIGQFDQTNRMTQLTVHLKHGQKLFLTFIMVEIQINNADIYLTSKYCVGSLLLFNLINLFCYFLYQFFDFSNLTPSKQHNFND